MVNLLVDGRRYNMSNAMIAVIHMTMISVENFVWCLYENLLAGSNLQSFYYWPMGTRQRFAGHPQIPAHGDLRPDNHVFFYFDQEPIWNDHWGSYDTKFESFYSHINLKILANSEHSSIKRQCLKSRGMLDWYYFFHGFAALDWFRDARYIVDTVAVDNAFLCFNNLISNHRAYRITLLAKLIENQSMSKGRISFHGDERLVTQELNDPWTQLSSKAKRNIQNFIVDKIALPITLDRQHIDGNSSAHFGHSEMMLWQQSLLHVVCETVFFEPKLHLTEKIFKPIVAARPFILVAAPGNLAYLRSYGFKTFHPWINESYDDIIDPDQRLNAIATEIEKISQLSKRQLNNLLREMAPVLDYNKKHFFGQFREIIVDEMLQNFETCIKLWNNGRVDDRVVPYPQNLRTVKQRFLA